MTLKGHEEGGAPYRQYYGHKLKKLETAAAPEGTAAAQNVSAGGISEPPASARAPAASYQVNPAQPLPAVNIYRLQERVNGSDKLPVPPFLDGFGVCPITLGQCYHAFLTILYLSTHFRNRLGASVEHVSHHSSLLR